MKNLFFLHTIDMFGDAIVELRVSDKPELTPDDDYFSYLGALTNEDADDMDKKGIDCTDEKNCIEYAKTKGMLIPEKYNLIVIP